MNNKKHKTTHNIKRVNFDTSMVLNYIDQHPHQLPVSSSPTTSKTSHSPSGHYMTQQKMGGSSVTLMLDPTPTCGYLILARF